MWCTNDCWNCEDNKCEHYINKKEIYFKYEKLQSNWNSLREYYKRKAEETKDSTALYDKWTKYSSVLDKMNELEGKKYDK